MLNRNAPERVTEALTRSQEIWQSHDATTPGAPKPSAFTIAFTREAGTYGAAIAREVGNRLGWPVYDGELIQRIADDLGVRRSLLESVDERQPGWVETSVKEFFSTPGVNEFAFFRHLLETILSLSKIGSCVIVGRGAAACLPAATTLRVRVVAPLEHRVAAVSREHNITLDEAKKRVQATDRDRHQFVMNHFRVNTAEAANYDLTLNAARYSVTDSADLVIAALERLSGKPASTFARKS